MKPFLFLSTMLLLLVACGESNLGTPAAPQPIQKPTQAPTNQHYKAGETVKVGDKWEVVVNSAKTEPNGEYNILKEGNVYLLIDVSLANISNEEQNTSSVIEWKLTGPDGQAYTTSFFSGSPPAPDGKVEAGAPARGTLAYEVPTSVKEFRLAFAPSLFTSGQTIWDISVP